MKTYTSKIYILLILILFGTGSFAQQLQVFKGSFEQLKAQAQKENKLILIDLYFEGCMPCKQMDNEVFPDPKIVSLLNKGYLLFKIDVFKEIDGKLLSRKYAVSGFPTFLLLDATGKLITMESGFYAVDRFAALLEAAKEQASKGLFRAFDTDLNKSYPDFYSARYMMSGQKFESSVVKEYLDKQSDPLSEVPFVCILNSNISHYNQLVYNHLPELLERYGASILQNKVTSIAKANIAGFGKNNQKDSLLATLDYIRPAYNERLWSVYLPIFITDYYKNGGNATDYLKLIAQFKPFTSWDAESNAYAQLIIDQKQHTDILNALELKYRTALTNTKTNAADQYKYSLIKAYLGHKEAAMDQILKLKKNQMNAEENPLISAQVIAELENAIKSNTVMALKPVNALTTIPYSLN
ncbi:thioredoxin family protein [Sphingobacterium spiritivorum]|uniref:thioredoxin family protein n=1 Tax=Sphingobacterium spiritivorum TaxID=258 RepID=UPI003DA48350